MPQVLPKGIQPLEPVATSQLLSSVIALFHASQPHMCQPEHTHIKTHPQQVALCNTTKHLQETGPPWFCSPQAPSPLFLAPTLCKDSTAALGEGLEDHLWHLTGHATLFHTEHLLHCHAPQALVHSKPLVWNLSGSHFCKVLMRSSLGRQFLR